MRPMRRSANCPGLFGLRLTNTGSDTFGNANLAATPLRLRLRKLRFRPKSGNPLPQITCPLRAKRLIIRSTNRRSWEARFSGFWMYVFADNCKDVQCGSKDQNNSKQRAPHWNAPFPRQLNLKAAPQLEQNYGTHLDTRVAQIAGKIAHLNVRPWV